MIALLSILLMQAPPTGLDALANETMEALAHLPEAGASQEHAGFYQALDLALEWPHEAFRAPLLRILQSKTHAEVTVRAAEALVNYEGDPAVSKALRSLLDDQRVVGEHVRSTVADRVKKLLVRGAIPLQSFEPSDRLLPLENGDAFLDPLWLPDMTVSRAAKQLGSTDLSISLQAFYWLASRGIVIDTAPVWNAWPKLDDDCRIALLSLPEHFRMGSDRLIPVFRKLLEDFEQYPGRLQGTILFHAAQIGVDDACEKARQVIGTTNDNASDGLTYSLVEWAYLALGACGDVDSDPQWYLAQLCGSATQSAGAAYALAASDSWRAAYAVVDWVANSERPASTLLSERVFGRLATRKWERPALRRYYVSSLCQLLPEVVLAGDTVGADAILSCEQAFTFRHCVRVLETLTGRIAPVQFHPFETDIAIEVAQAVAKDWAKWHAEVGTPQRKQP